MRKSSPIEVGPSPPTIEGPEPPAVTATPAAAVRTPAVTAASPASCVRRRSPRERTTSTGTLRAQECTSSANAVKRSLSVGSGMCVGLLGIRTEQRGERLPATAQPVFDGANRAVGLVRDLLHGQAEQVVQHDRPPLSGRELAQAPGPWPRAA